MRCIIGNVQKNLMVVPGRTPTDLLKSTIILIPKDNKASLPSVDNYRGISLFNSMCTLFNNVILLMFKAEFNTSDMHLVTKRDILQHDMWLIFDSYLIKAKDMCNLELSEIRYI